MFWTRSLQWQPQKSCRIVKQRGVKYSLPVEVQVQVEIPSVCRRPSVMAQCARRRAVDGDCWYHCLVDLGGLQQVHCASQRASTAARGTRRPATWHSQRQSLDRLRPQMNSPRLNSTFNSAVGLLSSITDSHFMHTPPAPEAVIFSDVRALCRYSVAVSQTVGILTINLCRQIIFDYTFLCCSFILCIAGNIMWRKLTDTRGGRLAGMP